MDLIFGTQKPLSVHTFVVFATTEIESKTTAKTASNFFVQFECQLTSYVLMQKAVEWIFTVGCATYRCTSFITTYAYIDIMYAWNKLPGDTS